MNHHTSWQGIEIPEVGNMANLKETAARLKAEFLGWDREEEYPGEAVEYVEQWYYWSNEKRAWIPDYDKF